MKNKLLFLLVGSITILMMTSGIHDILSSGAPIGSTGAPSELTCGKAGCHVGNNGTNNINTGAGILSIVSEQDIANYIPGATYDITVAMEEAGVERFGFSLTALDANNNKAGQLLVTDEQRTQIFEGSHQFTGREYITYRMIGTNPYEPGKGLWTFKWKAPDYAVGNITFYAAAVSANNDATDDGDLVYTQTLISEGEPLSINNFQHADISFDAFPNPVKNNVQVQFNQALNEPVIFILYNSEGKQVSSSANHKISVGEKSISIPVNNLSPGIYFLKTENNTFSETKKISVID